MKDKKIITQHNLSEMLTGVREKMYEHILHKTSNDILLTEDICSAAHEKIINKVNEGIYKEENKFHSWAMTVARNILVDYYRKTNLFRNVSTGPICFDAFLKFNGTKDSLLEEMEIDVIDIETEIGKVLAKQIKQLPSEQQLIIELVFFKGYPFKEIAKDYKMSINTALGRMRYALINLKKINKFNTELKDLALKQ